MVIIIMVLKGRFFITRNNHKHICTAYPEIRFYEIEQIKHYESYSCHDTLTDIQLILGDFDKKRESFLVRIHYITFSKPYLVRCIYSIFRICIIYY